MNFHSSGFVAADFDAASHVLHKLATLRLAASASFAAETSVRAPRKLFIFIIYRKNNVSKYPPKKDVVLKTEALLAAHLQPSMSDNFAQSSQTLR